MQILSGVGAAGAASVAGYVLGGDSTFGTSGDKFTYATQTNAATTNALGTASAGGSGASNSGVAGYIFGNGNKIQKILFSTDATSTLAAVLTSTNRQSVGFANYGVAGYCAGGFDESTRLNRIDKLTFATEVKSTVTDTLTINRGNQPSGFANFGVAGYVGGGRESAGQFSSSVDKLSFPSDTKSALGTGLTVTKISIGNGFCDKGVAGYIGGGTDSGDAATSSVDKFAMPSDTKSVATALLAVRVQVNGYSDSGVAGYWVGGSNDVAFTQTIFKYVFPGDTISNLGNLLVGARPNTSASFSDEGVL
jgi:hypothetical protein